MRRNVKRVPLEIYPNWRTLSWCVWWKSTHHWHEQTAHFDRRQLARNYAQSMRMIQGISSVRIMRVVTYDGCTRETHVEW